MPSKTEKFSIEMKVTSVKKGQLIKHSNNKTMQIVNLIEVEILDAETIKVTGTWKENEVSKMLRRYGRS